MWIELEDEVTFNFVNSELKRLIENEDMNAWADKLFGNGSGGYYMPVPDGLRFVEGMEDLINQYTIHETLPSAVLPGTYTAIDVTDDVEYAASDFVAIGKVAEGLTVSDTGLLIKENGDKYIVVVYRNGQIAIVDCQNNTFTAFDSGFFKPWKVIYHATTDSLVFFTSTALNVIRFSLTSGSVEFTTETDQLTSNNVNDGIQDRCIGTDDCIYFGTTLSAYVWKYDPTDDTFVAYGQVYDITTNTYVYHIAADDDFVYCGLRSNGKYWIVLINKSTEEKTSVGFEGNYTSSVWGLYDSEDGPYIRISLTRGDLPNISKKYRNGVEVTSIEGENLDYTIRDGRFDSVANTPTTWAENFSFEIDMSNLAGIGIEPEISYKNLDDEGFTNLGLTGLTKEDFSPNAFIASGTDLYGAFVAYGPVFIFDTTTDSVSFLKGYEGVSVHNVFHFDENRVYLSGYANDTREWDLNDTWNHGSVIATSGSSNPQKLAMGLSNAYYHYFNAKSGDYLYTFWERTRNDTGCGVSWYNTVSKEITHSDTAMIAYLKNYNVSHMLTINSGNTLILLTSPRGSASLPRLFIYDISTEKNLNLITPTTKDLPFLNGSSGIAFNCGTNTIVGLVNNIVYKLNITDLANPVIRNVPANMYPLASMSCAAQSSDGSIWFLNRPLSETYLYKLDPATFNAVRKSSDLGVNAHNRSMAITSDDKLYLLGGVTSVAEIDETKSKYFIEKLEL